VVWLTCMMDTWSAANHCRHKCLALTQRWVKDALKPVTCGCDCFVRTHMLCFVSVLRWGLLMLCCQVASNSCNLCVP
jgi:hypothetical protein